LKSLHKTRCYGELKLLELCLVQMSVLCSEHVDVCFFVVVEEGLWENGLSYECRTLLFKAIHNLLER